MSAANNGGPAFPVSHGPDYPNEIVGGMTMRDYFATKAPIDAQISTENVTKLMGCAPPGDFIENIAYWNAVGARLNYMWADAMLAERNKP